MERSPSDTILGIDLGTTNSCCAVASADGRVELIPHRGGGVTLPSIFAIDARGNERIGQEARRQWQLNPVGTLHATKRLMGRSARDEVVETVRRSVQYRVEGDDQGAVALECNGRRFSVEEIGARILRQLRDVASDRLGFRVERAVVTVPAYFTDRQRQAVKEAGALAELEVVRIINEPTAAALAYGLGRRLRERVLVYDLGGGTFDVSIIEIRDRVFEVKATGGDVFLGGLDFDGAIARHVLDDFRARHGIDLSTDPVAMQRISDLAERTKIDLSTRTAAPFSVPFITLTPRGQPLAVDLTFDRALLERLTAGLVDRSFQILDRVMEDAGIQPADVDEVLLVGGQTRMPAIQERLTRRFGRPPSKGVHPDEAVAIGAALYGWSLRETSDLRLQLLDVLPMAIGIADAAGGVQVVFPRNAAIPNARAVTATTSVDDQSELVVRIHQGDHPEAARNELLGTFTIDGVRPAPAGEARLEILLEVSVEGILSMSARDLDTGRQVRATVRIASA